MTADGSFMVGEGADLKAIFDKDGEACMLTLHGPLSEHEVFRLFNVLVPIEKRRVKNLASLECVGVCQQSLESENVAFSTGVVGKQTSEPAAVITFKRPDCKAAVAEAGITVLKLKRNDK